MNVNAKNILGRMIREGNQGLRSPSDLFNGIGQGGNDKVIHKLISEGYIEEVPQSRPALGGGQQEITFYRVAEKGYRFFDPFHIKLWHSISGDIRTIIIAAITALITTVIASVITNLLR